MIWNRPTAYNATAKHLGGVANEYLARQQQLSAIAKQEQTTASGVWEYAAFRGHSEIVQQANYCQQQMMTAIQASNRAKMRAYQHNCRCNAKSAHHNALCARVTMCQVIEVPQTLAQLTAQLTAHSSAPPPRYEITRPLATHRASNAPNAQQDRNTKPQRRQPPGTA